MLSPQTEIMLIAAVTAVACALPGVFLVLRRMALMSDAITHAVLFGIVLAFFAVGDVTSPALMLGAAATGVLTVALVELLSRTRLVREDAAIGLVFPVLFSAAVILISRYAGDTHLDIDAVLLGELAFAPFDRFEALGYDLGPRALWLMGAILAVSLVLLALFYKELKLSTFDAGLAAALGFAPAAVHYGLMTLVSVTAVGAFDSVGSVLVVALMIAPPAAAYLLTDRLATMLGLSALIGAASALAGVWLALWLDASIAGSMAAMAGLAFGLAWVLAPGRGLVAGALRRSRQRAAFAELTLAVHLLHHEDTLEADEESRRAHLGKHLRWPAARVEAVVRAAERRGLVAQQGERLVLTEQGRRFAADAFSA